MSALGRSSASSEALNFFVESLRRGYADTAFDALHLEYSHQLSELEEAQSALHTEVFSLYEALLAGNPDPEICKILSSRLPEEGASTGEILAALMQHGEEYLNALENLKQEIKLTTKAERFKRSCSSQMRAILSKVDEIGAPLSESVLLGIICGAPAACLDPLPSDMVLGTATRHPEAARQSIKAALALKTMLIAEYADLLCMDISDARRVSSIPYSEQLKELRSLKEAFSHDSWVTNMRKLPFEIRGLASAAELGRYLKAKEKLASFERRHIALPRQYNRPINPAELLEKGVNHPSVAALDFLLPPFALQLPAETHRKLLGTHRKLQRSLRAVECYKENSELLADILIFGIYYFGSYEPAYSMETIHQRMQRVGSYSGSFEAFAEYFAKKVFPQEDYLFRRSLEQGVHRSTIFRFDPCPYLAKYRLDEFYLSAEGSLRQAAEEGHELASKIMTGSILRYQLDYLIKMTRISRDLFGAITDGPSDSKFDVSKACQIARQPRNRGLVLTSLYDTPQNLLTEVLAEYWTNFRYISPPAIQEAREDLDAVGIKNLSIAPLADEVLSACAAFGSLFDTTELKVILDSLDESMISDFRNWRHVLEAFEPFYDRYSGEFDIFQERAEGLLSELQAWRRQYEQ